MSKKLIAAIAAATLAVVAAVVIILAAGGTTGGGPSQAACKQAMEQDFKQAIAHPDASPASEPAACKGLPDQVLQRLAGEVMAGQ